MVKLSVQQGRPDLDKRSVKALLTLLCVLFIAAQTVGLSHSHEGGLSHCCQRQHQVRRSGSY